MTEHEILKLVRFLLKEFRHLDGIHTISAKFREGTKNDDDAYYLMIQSSGAISNLTLEDIMREAGGSLGRLLRHDETDFAEFSPRPLAEDVSSAERKIWEKEQEMEAIYNQAFSGDTSPPVSYASRISLIMGRKAMIYHLMSESGLSFSEDKDMEREYRTYATKFWEEQGFPKAEREQILRRPYPEIFVFLAHNEGLREERNGISLQEDLKCCDFYNVAKFKLEEDIGKIREAIKTRGGDRGRS